MSHHCVVLPNVFLSLKFVAIGELEGWLVAQSYDALDVESVEAEIVNIWLLLFRSVDALRNALNSLGHDHESGDLCRVCCFYTAVLDEMKFKVCGGADK
jgi:hypothetical protein